jgi:16S rRNA (adenine1518-N6/adenine1519-N6)-dimethyltransferase
VEVSNRKTARAVARRAGVSAKGRLSQNFLVDRAVVDDIVATLAPSETDLVFEIGPGLGVLTKELATRAAKVVAVDIDPACVRATRMAVKGNDNVEVLEGDARDFSTTELGLASGWLCVGNLPYHLTGALLTSVLEQEQPPRRSVFMMQREVAQRLAATEGGWSLATVAIRSLADVEIVRDVAPTSFDPMPKVYSSVVRVTPAAARLDPAIRPRVLALAKKTFQMRRKTLRHGIANAVGGNEEMASQLLARAEIDPSRRPGTLSLEEWRRLARAAAELAEPINVEPQ